MNDFNVPYSWDNQKLGFICKINIGGTPSRDQEEYWDLEKITNNYWVSIRDLNKKIIFSTEENITDSGITNSNVKLVKKGTLLMSFKLTVGRVSFTGVDLYTNEAICALEPKNENQIDKKYLYYIIPFIKPEKYSETAIKGKTLNLKKLKSIIIPFPLDLKEQQKIASILENIDNNIDKTQEIIEKYEMMKQGLMHDLFNKGIDENGKPHTEFKDSELGIIPTNWDEVTLESVILKILDFRGKTPKKIGMEWGNGEITALSANNVEMGNINFEKETYYGSEDLYNKWMNNGDCEFKDIVMTMEAPLGNIAQIPDNRRYILSQRVILFKINENKVIKDYLANFLRSNFFQGQLIKYSSGTTAKGIQQSQLLKLKVRIPKLILEQNKISEVLNSIEDKVQSEKKYLHKLQKIKTGLMQDLLTGKVRVKT